MRKPARAASRNPFVLLNVLLCFGFLLAGCSTHNQEKAREDARKAGDELKRDGRELKNGVDRAIQPDSKDASTKLAEGKEKLEAAGNKLEVAGSNASVKLGQAGLIAQVKAKMAADAGLSTMGIDVDANGSVVTLRGHVGSQAQKDAADQAAAHVDGVTRVNNQLAVQP